MLKSTCVHKYAFLLCVFVHMIVCKYECIYIYMGVCCVVYASSSRALLIAAVESKNVLTNFTN